MSHSNSDNSNADNTEPQAKRRRYVEFEPVRICSISGVVSCFLIIKIIERVT